MENKKFIAPTAMILFVIVFFVILPFMPTFQPRSYNNLNLDGFNGVYRLGQPIKFTIIVSGYGIAPCTGPATTIFNIEDPTKPVFSDNGGLWPCQATQSLTSYTYYYPSKSSQFSILINKTGIYKLGISWGHIRSRTSFDIIPVSMNATNSANDQTIIQDISYLDAVKKFLAQHSDAVARLENNEIHVPTVVDYYTKTRLFNGTMGTFSAPQYRTLKLLIHVNLVNNTAIPSYMDLVCSVSSYDNKTGTDYTLFPHDDLNLTFNEAMQSDRCLGGNGK